MRHSFWRAGAAIALVSWLCGCGSNEDTKAADTAVDRFHEHWNAGAFKTIYHEAHKNLRNTRSADEIIAMLERGKQKYGAFRSGSRRSWGFESDKGVTNLKLKYDSVFEKGSAVEAFVFRMSGDKALLVSYEIMSPDTAKKIEEVEKTERETKRKTDEEKRQAERDARTSPRKP